MHQSKPGPTTSIIFRDRRGQPLEIQLLERGSVVFASITLVSSGLWHAPRIGYRRVPPSEPRSRYAAAPATRPPAMIIPSHTRPPAHTRELGPPNRKNHTTTPASPPPIP